MPLQINSHISRVHGKGRGSRGVDRERERQRQRQRETETETERDRDRDREMKGRETKRVCFVLFVVIVVNFRFWWLTTSWEDL